MEILYITLLTVIAGGVGTLTGFGTSTIMVPVLLLFLPLAPTLLLVGIIHWFGDIWKIALFREGVRWRLILLFGAPGVILTFLGARLVFSVSETLLSRILGGFLVAYVAFLFFNPSFKFRQNALTAVTGGALSGFFAGIFGVGGAMRMPRVARRFRHTSFGDCCFSSPPHLSAHILRKKLLIASRKGSFGWLSLSFCFSLG